MLADKAAGAGKTQMSGVRVGGSERSREDPPKLHQGLILASHGAGGQSLPLTVGPLGH